MSTCLILTRHADAQLAPIAECFACGGELSLWFVEQRRGEDQIIDVDLSDPEERETFRAVLSEFEALRSKASESPGGSQDEAAGAESDANDTPAVDNPGIELRLRRIRSEEPARAVVDEVVRHSVRLLLLPWHEKSHAAANRSIESNIFRDCPCDLLYVSQENGNLAACREIVVATRGGRHASVALSRAVTAAEHAGGAVTALYVQLAVDEVALEIGERRLAKIAHRAGARKNTHVRKRVELADSFAAGVAQALDEPCDLLIFGAPDGRPVQRVINANALPTEGARALAIAIFRSADPYPARLQERLGRTLQRAIPQLDRENRVDLVDRIQSSSQSNFDFTALMGLSTLIATLGLLQDSTAVVIGAMLVAPLMTPLVAIGLAVVQGNRLLLRMALRTVSFGFVLAFVLAFGVAVLASWGGGPLANWPNAQMLARASPGVLDLLVAFASGLAAAYAMGRSNLLSALPGVAIAAALVPPIATAGVATALGEFPLAGGALLLFLTNIVAIILSSSVSLWAVGIRDLHAHGTRERWTPKLMFALCLLALGLAIYESRPPLPAKCIDDVIAVVGEIPNCEVAEVRLERLGGRRVLWVAVNGRDTPTEGLMKRLQAIALKQLGEETEVRLEYRNVRWSGGE